MTGLTNSGSFGRSCENGLKAEPVGATLEARFLIAAFCRLGKSLSHSEQTGWLVGAVGIENNGVRNFKDLRGMTRNTKSLKKDDEACKGILIAPSKLPRFSSGIEIPTAWDFRPRP
jgi:hypothetical protein